MNPILNELLPKIGDQLGRYKIVDILGRGAFGAVFRAKQAGLDVDVAIKVMIPYLDDSDGQFVERFEQEAQIMKRLEHPNTLKVRDFGRTDHNIPFLVTEFVRGRTLRAVLSTGGGLGTERTIRVAKQILGSLAEAHDQGIVHRDLKPENLMLRDIVGQHDALKVLDFGVAKVTEDSQVQTRTGSATGTPWYMAPEQARGEKALDGRADLYALGLILAECVTGERVVVDGDAMSAVYRHARPEPLAFPSETTTSPLWPIIEKATRKGIALRYDDALEMLADVEALERSTWSDETVNVDQGGLTQQRGGVEPHPSPTPSSGSDPHHVPSWDSIAITGPETPPPSALISDSTMDTPVEALAETAVAALAVELTDTVIDPVERPKERRLWRLVLGIAVVALAVVALATGTLSGRDEELSATDSSTTTGAPSTSEPDADVRQEDVSTASVGSTGDPLAPESPTSCEALGGVQGCLEQGLEHYNDGAFVEAARLFDAACWAGSSVGCHDLARLIEGEPNLQIDYRSPEELYRLSCDLNFMRGCNVLGVLHLSGQTERPDPAYGVELLVRACLAEVPEACSNVGRAYQRAQGVAQDLDVAERSYQEGCRLGDQRGCERLEMLRDRRLSAPPDP